MLSAPPMPTACQAGQTRESESLGEAGQQRDRAYGQMRRLLYFGAIPEGQRLREPEWTRKLGVNRSALREAMAQLAGEGLLDRLPARGYSVPKPAARDLAEALEVRILVEVGAVQRICRLGMNTPEILGQLEAACAQLESLSAQGYYYAVLEADLKFHRLLVSLAGNQRLSGVHQSPALGVASGSRVLDAGTPLGAREHVHEHRQIIQAMQGGHGDRAESLVRGHLSGAKQGAGKERMPAI